MAIEALYSDLDGTLLGPGGSLFAAPGGGFTARTAEALLALHRAGVQLVLISGRTRGQMSELARALSAGGYIAETGALIVDRRVFPEAVHRAFGSFEGSGTPFDRMTRSGAGAFLLDTYRGVLEPHTPWSSQPREATMLFRGLVDVPEAATALSDAGYGWLDLLDNGLIPRAFPGLDVDRVHAYHLVPRGVSKEAGVRRHRELTGLAREATAAIGDSRSDLEMAGAVDRMFVTANGRPTIEGALPANATFTNASHGEGFAEAVETLLS